MTTGPKPRVIAIEEHYLDSVVDEALGGMGGGGGPVRDRLADMDGDRITEMDEAGVDVQVLSHCPPGAQIFEADKAGEMARGLNDRLQAVILARPDRFAGFAALPTRNPEAAADELERCVTQLGFKGGMVHGLTENQFIDMPRFRPIFTRAAALDVPIYIHPNWPHAAVVDAYYKDYAEKYPSIVTAAWGFTVETATSGLRLILSGIFEELPNLKIILGHLGEGLPFSAWRIDESLRAFSRPDVPVIPFRELFRKHFWITTSGNFSDPALMCCAMELGIDRILFSVDWPYVENAPGTDWMARIPFGTEDREKILHGNAETLLKM